MTRVRIIPVLTISDGKLVKTVQFKNPRTLGSPMAAVRLFNHRNVDEMVILFIDGKIDFDLFDQIAKECFMPLAVGGGIRSVEDVDRLFALGTDKVVIRTHTELIPAVAAKYGAQAVIWAFDYHPNERISALPGDIGEVLLTSLVHEGKMMGYDILNIEKATGISPLIKIIAHGGAGTLAHFLEAYRAGATALAASSIWFYTETTPQMVKEYLNQKGVSVRLF